MKKKKPFLIRVLRSFRYAFVGILSGVKERNMKVHVGAMIAVLLVAILFDLSREEWVMILIAIGLVLSAELVNTAVEELANIIRDELHLEYHRTKRARDTAAGAVLVLAIVAACIGSVVFLPKVVKLLGLL